MEATRFCERYGIPLKLVEPTESYMHGWGRDCHGAKLVVCTWELAIQDKHGNTCTLKFDLVNGSSPLFIGLDVGQYANMVNLTDLPYVTIKRPHDISSYTFHTYVAPDSADNPDCIRVRVELFPRHAKGTPTISAMLSNISKQVTRDPMKFAMRVHRYTHIHPEQMKDICRTAGILEPDLETAIDVVSAACELCTRNGRPLPSKKVSLSHVNEAFNEEVQIDFTYVVVYRPDHTQQNGHRREKYTLLVITDVGTRYTETAIVESRDIETIIRMYDSLWLCRHGASKRVSADDEYHRRRLLRYLDSHNIEFKPRPTRRHNKLGIVERKNGTLKEIIRRLAMEKSHDHMPTIVARSTFLCNIFSGNQTMSSFELARGYKPSLLGIPATYATADILEAHTHQAATRALQRVLRSRRPNTPTPGMFKPGDLVWVWYATSKQNEDDRWIQAQVVQTHPHFMETRRIKDGRPCKGPTMKPAYEDIRVAPRNALARRLMECTLETELGYGDSTERGVEQNDAEQDAPQNNVSSLMTGVKRSKDRPRKSAGDDIGEYAHDIHTHETKPGTTLQSDRAREIEKVYDLYGTRQVSRSKLESAPPWLLDEAFETEYKTNWADVRTR